MASFKKVANGKYKLTVELGYVGKKRKRKIKRVNAKNDTEARKQLVLFEAEVLSNQIIDHSKLTVKGFYHQWLEHFANDNYGPRTLRETKNVIENRLLPDYGDAKIKDIEKIHMVHFFSDLKKDGKRLDGKKGTLSSSSLKNIYKAINALFKVAEEWELIDSNPCEKIKLPTVKHKKSNVLSAAESRTLFNLLEDENVMWKLIVQVAAVTGMRQGEIAALEGKHLDFSNNAIVIDQSFVNVKGEGIKLKSTKTDRTRKVSVPDDLMKSLKKLRAIKYEQQMESKNLWKWEGHLFLFSNEFGQPLRPDSISQWWLRFTEKKKYKDKLKKIRFHDLRHTSATLLIDKGVHAKIIQERLGHSKISTTMDVYGHVLHDAEKSSANHFKELFK